MTKPLEAIKYFKQFILYKLEWDEIKGKYNKYPYDYINSCVFNAHDSKYWDTYENIKAISNLFGNEYGVAFVFTDEDPFFFVDLDNCLINNNWSEESLKICSYFPGAAIEISVSGKGLHIFGSYKSIPQHKCDKHWGGFYHTKRFVALTENSIVGDCSLDFTDILQDFINNYIPINEVTDISKGWTTEAVEGYGNAIENDNDLINKALNTTNASNVFGNKASFRDLWEFNQSKLALCFPDQTGKRPIDLSATDSALAQHLAFWTGNNCERIRNLMLQSNLIRDKWNRNDYLQRTILNAVSRQIDIYTYNKPEVINPTLIEAKNSNAFVNSESQLQLFKGCFYVESLNKILTTDGELFDQERFKVKFGGNNFVMDSLNSKISGNAWEAFTQNKDYSFPKVFGVTFRPDLPFGTIIHADKRSYVNKYIDLETESVKGDVTIFLNHMQKLLPNERDRLILTSYMAAIVQYKGVKFRWAPLIQGVEGNGKTILSECVLKAVGDRYTHSPKASKLGKDFNAWMVDKVFYKVEDVYSQSLKYKIWEDLKPMIAGGSSLEIEGKGVDQISVNICGNFIFNSNHKDALPKTNNDRRLCMLFTAQQSVSDKIRDGMTDKYFHTLAKWLNEGGYSYVTYYLTHFNIPDEFNPAEVCNVAPTTSSTYDAIDASKSDLELQIEDIIASETMGMKNGWISTYMLLNNANLPEKISGKRLNYILKNMGYVRHPGLKDGRTNGIVMPDGAVTRLYIKDDCEHQKLRKYESIVNSYMSDQV